MFEKLQLNLKLNGTTMIKKILIVFFLLCNTVYAGEMENQVLEFEKKRLSTNKRMQVQEIKIISKQEIKLEGWFMFIIDIELKLQDKVARIKDIIFTNGKVIATDLHDMTTGESLKKNIKEN